MVTKLRTGLVLMTAIACSAPVARAHLWASSSVASTNRLVVVSIDPATGAYGSVASIEGGDGLGAEDLVGDPFWQGGTLWSLRRGTTTSYLAAWNPVAQTFLSEVAINTPSFVRSLSIDPTDGRFYGTTASDLYTIDPLSGDASLIGPTTGWSVDKALAFNRTGNLFGVGKENKLVSIDKTSGATSLVATLDVNRMEGLAWSSETDAMLGYGYGTGLTGYALFEIDLNSGALTHLGPSAIRQSALGITGLAADFNRDGTVTLEDLAIWHTYAGTETGALATQGDANGDGAVNGVDYLAWQRQLGSTIVAPGAMAVPEPRAAALGIIALGAFLAPCRRPAKSTR